MEYGRRTEFSMQNYKKNAKVLTTPFLSVIFAFRNAYPPYAWRALSCVGRMTRIIMIITIMPLAGIRTPEFFRNI